MSVDSLHVTNGDSVLYTWKKAGLLGTHLAWRDILHDGPVPAGLTLEELSEVRAQYLCQNGYGNPIKVRHDFEKRDALIRRAKEFDEIVLWFEHDLYDQLHLLQILHVLAEMDLAAGGTQLVQSDQYLGTLQADELLSLLPKRRFITSAIADGAARAWNAFTQDTPNALAAAAKDKYVGLPYLRDALARLCQEYPSSENGLSRTEKQILEATAQGSASKEEIFRRTQSREEASFLGDASCYRHIDDLAREPAPLIAQLDQGYEPTVLGRRVLSGDADWLEHKPLDRWIGGVHLTPENHWRWDDSVGEFTQR